jgi:hypothetical protein
MRRWRSSSDDHRAKVTALWSAPESACMHVGDCFGPEPARKPLQSGCIWAAPTTKALDVFRSRLWSSAAGSLPIQAPGDVVRDRLPSSARRGAGGRRQAGARVAVTEAISAFATIPRARCE